MDTKQQDLDGVHQRVSLLPGRWRAGTDQPINILYKAPFSVLPLLRSETIRRGWTQVSPRSKRAVHVSNHERFFFGKTKIADSRV